MLTPEQLRQMADAIEAFRAGKPVEFVAFDGSWKPELGDPISWTMTFSRRPKPPEPKLRAWKRDEAPPIPFEVVAKSTGNRLCVVAANNVSFWLGGVTISDITPDELLANYTQRDGTPCGVLE